MQAVSPATLKRSAWAVLALVCVSQFMVILDASIVNVALPSIQRDLGFSGTGLAWVVNGYLLTFAASCCWVAAPLTCSASAGCWSPGCSCSPPRVWLPAWRPFQESWSRPGWCRVWEPPCWPRRRWP